MAVRYSARGLVKKTRKKDSRDDLPDVGAGASNPWRSIGLFVLLGLVGVGAYIAREQLDVPPPTFQPSTVTLSSNALPCSTIEISGSVMVCRLPRAAVQSKPEGVLKSLGAATAREAGDRGFMRVVVLAEEDGAMLVAFDAIRGTS